MVFWRDLGGKNRTTKLKEKHSDTNILFIHFVSFLIVHQVVSIPCALFIEYFLIFSIYNERY